MALKAISSRKLKILKPYLDELNEEVEVASYISSDPVCFMHAFDQKDDQLIAGFFAALMAWGRRDIVLAKVSSLLERIQSRPFEFVTNLSDNDFSYLKGFKHRTFKDTDVFWLMKNLQSNILRHGSFSRFWKYLYDESSLRNEHFLYRFHEHFFEFHPETPHRVRKHIADAQKKSSCKRLSLFLRWAVRKPSVVDLGILDAIPQSELVIPLDVHVARVARTLGLLTRSYNDWAAVMELQKRLEYLNPSDPCRYDYALFGIGVLKKEIPKDFILNSPL